jgi:signal transduction histidine kinase
VSTPRLRIPFGAVRVWFTGHKQRLAYVLAAVFLLVTVGAAVAGGVSLRHSANIERETLRLQQLGSSALRVANLAQGAADAQRTESLDLIRSDFRRVQAHDPAAAERIRPAYLAFLHGSTRRFDASVAGLLARFEAKLNAEVQRQARAAQVTNPRARVLLILAVIAAALLVVALIWQFKLQQRAGRIDRDHARRAEELARLRDDFVGVVSHELRTPLTSILGYLELIADESASGLTSKQREYFDVVGRNAHRLLRLVSDLLLVAETRSGLPLDAHTVDLTSLARESVEAAQVAAGERDVGLTLVDTRVVSVHGDSVRLAQVVDNLVSNAIKFSPRGGQVTVATGAGDTHAYVEVTDSGMGIALEDREQIFERFFRTREATAHAVKGVGLGLAIAKSIIDAHGGTISVQSDVGVGTSFRVELPRG